jgi:hypothetical protein
VDHPLTLVTSNDLAGTFQAAGRLPEAITLFEETMRRRQAKLGPDHPSSLNTMNNLANAYREAGRLVDCLLLHEQALKGLRDKVGLDHPRTLNVMNNLAVAYRDAGRLAEAEDLLRKALSIRRRKSPDDWRTFDTGSLLGGCLLKQQKYAEAESLLVEGYEGMKGREAAIPSPKKSTLAQSAARIVQLYDAWGKPEQAAQWRKKTGVPLPAPDSLPDQPFADP